MATSVATESRARPLGREEAASVPWYVLALAVGATSIAVGVIWDISWHRTIGRDTFWTPAHVAIYLGGVVGSLCGAWLALKTTFFGGAAERAAAVRFWGARAPLGAWMAIWGGLAMLTSAPFDDWWHNAYGLDVEILSPPHTVLALGMLGVTLGALLLALATQNRSTAVGDERAPGLVYAYVAGVMLALIAILGTEYRWTNEQRTGTFYVVSALVYPLFLAAFARAGRLRWPATSAAGVYMLLSLAMIWILPLFPAEPKLAPIYNPVTSMVADCWPLLLLFPALAIDLVERRWKRGDWLLTPVLAAVFLAVFWAVQWHFSAFLLTDAADNGFFAADRQWSYEVRPGEWQDRFWGLESDPFDLRALAIATVLALVSTRAGLWWGSWMRKVRR